MEAIVYQVVNLRGDVIGEGRYEDMLLVLQRNPTYDLIYKETGRCASYVIPQEFLLPDDSGTRNEVARALVEFCRNAGVEPISYAMRYGWKTVIWAQVMMENPSLTSDRQLELFWEMYDNR